MSSDVLVVLIGLPGAGKGTQAQLLARQGWFHINVGGLVRSEVAAATTWGAQAAARMRSGDLLPSQDVLDLLARELRRGTFPLVVDGYPRRLSEASTLPDLCAREVIFIPFFLDIPPEAAMARLAGRVVCGRCEYATRRTGHTACPRCSSPLVSRGDDSSREAIGRRLENFERETTLLIEYYRLHGELETVDALLDETSLHAEITSRIARRCR
jgi:adenylate kinase